MEHELHDPRAVAQVDEDQATVVAAAMDPARDARVRARPLGGELAAPRVAVGVRPRCVLHDSRLDRRIVGITFCSSVRAPRPTACPCSSRCRVLADDRHEAGADPVGVPELALERAAGELELGAAALPGARRARARTRVSRLRGAAFARTPRTGRRARGAIGMSGAASSIRSIPAAHPRGRGRRPVELLDQAGRSGRPRRRPTVRRARRS